MDAQIQPRDQDPPMNAIASPVPTSSPRKDRLEALGKEARATRVSSLGGRNARGSTRCVTFASVGQAPQGLPHPQQPDREQERKDGKEDVGRDVRAAAEDLDRPDGEGACATDKREYWEPARETRVP